MITMNKFQKDKEPKYEVLLSENLLDIGLLKEKGLDGTPKKVYARFNGYELLEYGGANLVNWIHTGKYLSEDEWFGATYKKAVNEIVKILKIDTSKFSNIQEGKNMNTKEITVKLGFLWDEDEISGCDRGEFVIKVPENVSQEEVAKEISECHRYLDFEDDTDMYGKNGRDPYTLLDYVCEKNGWEKESMEYDIDFEFD